jgi:hypothetical protein
MPRVVRWFLKTALVYFAAALLLNIGLSVPDSAAFLPPGLQPVYLHLLVVGWISQLIMGVAIWMFPKYSLAAPRGKEWINWAVYLLLNGGLLLRAVAEPAVAVETAAIWKDLLAASALLQWAAGMLFAGMVWPRVKVK